MSCATLVTLVSMDIAILLAQVAAATHHATNILVSALPATLCSLLTLATTSASSATSLAVPLATVPTPANLATPTSSSATTPVCAPATLLQTPPTLPLVSALEASHMMLLITSVLITAASVTVSLVEELHAAIAILAINWPTTSAMLSV